MDRATTSSSDIPIARNLSITFSMSFIPAFMLLMCRSVEIESGRKPCLHHRDRHAPRETASAVADVEDHAALAARDHPGVHLAVVGQLVAQARSNSACRCRPAAVSS